MFPAKKIPGTDTLSQKRVKAGTRSFMTVTTPSLRRSPIGTLKPVARITSSPVKDSRPSQVVASAVTRTPSAPRSMPTIDPSRT